MTSGSPDIDALVLVDDGRRWLRLTRPLAVLVADSPGDVPRLLHEVEQQTRARGCHAVGYFDVRGRRRVRVARRSAGQAACPSRRSRCFRRASFRPAIRPPAASRPRSAARGRRGIARRTWSASIGSNGTSPTATRIRSTAPSRSRRRSTAKRAICSARSCGRSGAGTRRGCASVTSRSARRPRALRLPARTPAGVAADEGHGTAWSHHGRGRRCRGDAAPIRQGARRERDDRRHGAQRSRPDRASRIGRGAAPLRGREVSDRLADDLGGRLRQHRQPRRDHGGDVPLGVDHGSAEGADDGDHRRARGSAAGIYTGTVGYVAPNGDATFNVAIRTALVDTARESLTFGVGSGVIWDSDAEAEYDECLLKGSVLTAAPPDFESARDAGLGA